jgi:diguanylate cyclase (GGDEF)-like protein
VSALTTIGKVLYRLTLPGGLLLVAATGILRSGMLANSAEAVLFLPAAIAVAGLVLSAVFRRSLLFFAMLVLGTAQAALAWTVPNLSFRTGQTLFNVIAILVPLNLVVLAFVRERGIISAAGRRRLALVASEIIVAGLVCLPQLTPIAGWLDRAFLPEPVSSWSSWSHLSQPGLVAFVLAGVAMVVLLARRYHPSESGLLWALVASFVALRLGGTSYRAAVYFACGGLAIVVALLETSYKMAYHDELTKLPSRRSLNEDLMKLPPFYAISMVDVDHFKKFNDTYGHEAGDEVLRLVASRLARVTGGGKAYRYGGEEFAIVFPGKTASDVLGYLEGLRRVIEQSSFVVRGQERRSGKKGKNRPSREVKKKEVNVTVSIGVAASEGERAAPADVLRLADQGLYRAKAKGRNCTVSVRAKKGSGSAQPSMYTVGVS